jgi:hypothetical protein
VVVDDLVHLLLVPVAGVVGDRLGRWSMPARPSSSSVALTIGESWEKSVERLVISAASTICWSETAVCAL